MLEATRLVTNSLVKNLSNLGFKENDVRPLVQKIQTKALVGKMRILKSTILSRPTQSLDSIFPARIIAGEHDPARIDEFPARIIAGEHDPARIDHFSSEDPRC